MATPDDMWNLGVMQLSDSFFPAGLYATSSGLEGMFMSGEVATAASLVEFNRTCLEQQLGPGDCTIMSTVHDMCASREYDGIAKADGICGAMKTVREAREASFRSGVQLARCVRGFRYDDHVLDWYCRGVDSGSLTGAYPVSFAVCCSALGIPKRRALLMLMYGFVASTAGAALRLGIIQHFEAQAIIHELKPVISAVADTVSSGRLEDVWQFSPHLEISQMHHEVADSKMFIT